MTNDIKKDEIFTKKNIMVIRPGLGMHPKHYEIVLGKKAKKKIKKGTALKQFLIR